MSNLRNAIIYAREQIVRKLGFVPQFADHNAPNANLMAIAEEIADWTHDNGFKAIWNELIDVIDDEKIATHEDEGSY